MQRGCSSVIAGSGVFRSEVMSRAGEGGYRGTGTMMSCRSGMQSSRVRMLRCSLILRRDPWSQVR